MNLSAISLFIVTSIVSFLLGTAICLFGTFTCFACFDNILSIRVYKAAPLNPRELLLDWSVPVVTITQTLTYCSQIVFQQSISERLRKQSGFT